MGEKEFYERIVSIMSIANVLGESGERFLRQVRGNVLLLVEDVMLLYLAMILSITDSRKKGLSTEVAKAVFNESAPGKMLDKVDQLASEIHKFRLDHVESILAERGGE